MIGMTDRKPPKLYSERNTMSGANTMDTCMPPARNTTSVNTKSNSYGAGSMATTKPEAIISHSAARCTSAMLSAGAAVRAYVAVGVTAVICVRSWSTDR
jgi:hypothetical protein